METINTDNKFERLLKFSRGVIRDVVPLIEDTITTQIHREKDRKEDLNL